MWEKKHDGVEDKVNEYSEKDKYKNIFRSLFYVAVIIASNVWTE
jgi:hypothetical protein